MPQLIAGVKVILIVGAVVLSAYALIDSRGKSPTAWAIFLLSVAELLA